MTVMPMVIAAMAMIVPVTHVTILQQWQHLVSLPLSRMAPHVMTVALKPRDSANQVVVKIASTTAAVVVQMNVTPTSTHVALAAPRSLMVRTVSSVSLITIVQSGMFVVRVHVLLVTRQAWRHATRVLVEHLIGMASVVKSAS